MKSIIDEMTNAATGSRGPTINYRKKATHQPDLTPPPTTAFPSPYCNVPLFKKYLNGNGNVREFADHEHRSPGQMLQIINNTARMVTSYLNENLDYKMLLNVYQYKEYFLKSVRDYEKYQSYSQGFSSDKQWCEYFKMQTPLKRMMLRNMLDDITFNENDKEDEL
jgi:hypothetical protein